MFKVWITKYALTAGIQEYDSARRCENVNNDMISVVGPSAWNNCLFFHGEGLDWHTTRESAVDRANAIVAAKIVSLNKQMDKLKKLKFS